MKKTVTKILMAVMAATMIVCTAAGCGGKKEETASSSSEQSSTAASTEASVSTTATKSGSVTTANGELSEDMIRYAYYSTDANGINAGFVKLDDRSQFGYGGFAAVNGTETELLADGKITGLTEKKNSDGSTTSSFTMVSAHPVDGDQSAVFEVTEYADGTVKLTVNGKSYNMTKTTDMNEIRQGMEEMAEKINSQYGTLAQEQTDAATIDCACKSYYAMVVSGSVEGKTDENAAKSGTVKEALEYMGLGDVNFDFSKFTADGDGNIVVNDGAAKAISENTTFEELYGAMQNDEEISDESDASTIDCACKSYYAMVVSGSVEGKTDENAAKSGTVKEALEYMGLGDVNFDFSKFTADGDGNIVVNDGAAKAISENTTFEELYGAMQNDEEISDESDASTIDCACKSYYAMVVSGSVEGKTDENAAKSGTVKEALEYMGLGDVNFDFSKFTADGDGNIVVNDGAAKAISENTTFEELYK